MEDKFKIIEKLENFLKENKISINSILSQEDNDNFPILQLEFEDGEILDIGSSIG